MTTSMPMPREIITLSDADLLQAIKEIHEDVQNLPEDGILQRVAVETKILEPTEDVNDLSGEELMAYCLCFLGEASLRWAKTQEAK